MQTIWKIRLLVGPLVELSPLKTREKDAFRVFGTIQSFFFGWGGGGRF